MSMARRILVALAGVILTALYWGAAWIDLFTHVMCRGGVEACGNSAQARLSRMFDHFTIWLAVYVLILCAGGIVIPLLRGRK